MRPVLLASLLLVPTSLSAQAPDPNREVRAQAVKLDGSGNGAEARVIWQRLVDSAPDAAAKAAMQRRIAMSWAFEGSCANAVRYQILVIDYWRTREAAEPQNAFFQEGEMANESGRVCIDAGDLDNSQRYYRLGYELGNKEPEPRTHPRSLWDFRLAHAEARVAARRGDKAEAAKQVALARKALDGDPKMAEGQRRFFPYLEGYVALYTGDLATAAAKFDEALAIEQNKGDPFVTYLIGVTHEKMGHADMAMEFYEKAYALAEGNHNPAAAIVRREVGKKLKP